MAGTCWPSAAWAARSLVVLLLELGSHSRPIIAAKPCCPCRPGPVMFRHSASRQCRKRYKKETTTPSWCPFSDKPRSILGYLSLLQSPCQRNVCLPLSSTAMPFACSWAAQPCRSAGGAHAHAEHRGLVTAAERCCSGGQDAHPVYPQHTWQGQGAEACLCLQLGSILQRLVSATST